MRGSDRPDKFQEQRKGKPRHLKQPFVVAHQESKQKAAFPHASTPTFRFPSRLDSYTLICRPKRRDTNKH